MSKKNEIEKEILKKQNFVGMLKNAKLSLWLANIVTFSIMIYGYCSKNEDVSSAAAVVDVPIILAYLGAAIAKPIQENKIKELQYDLEHCENEE